MVREQQVDTSFSGAVGRALWLPVKAVMYTLKPWNWFNSWEKVSRDMKVAISDVTDPRPKICLYADVSESERRSGVEVTYAGPGVVALSLARCRIVDLDELSQKK